VTAVRDEMDATVRKLQEALRQRAKEVASS
jgi:hypothetical protein